MPVDFDVCALSNLLLLIFSKNMPLNEFDMESIEFIEEVVRSRDYIRRPFDVAPWYAETALIIYHISRLISSGEVSGLENLRGPLLDEIWRRFDLETVFMHRVLLSTSAMRLGDKSLLDATASDYDNTDELGRGFYYFRGSPLAGRENSILWKLARYPLFQIRFRCDAVNLALILEHETWRLGSS
jgi:hypothetical protein